MVQRRDTEIVIFAPPLERGKPFSVTVALPVQQEILTVDLSDIPYERLQQLYENTEELYDVVKNVLMEHGWLEKEGGNDREQSVSIEI